MTTVIRVFLLFLSSILFLASFAAGGVFTVTPPAATVTPRPPTPTGFPLVQETLSLENGLTWTECAVPNHRYSGSKVEIAYLETCVKIPVWNETDKKRQAEKTVASGMGSDLRLVIGGDTYTITSDSSHGCCDYEYARNDQVLIETSAPLVTFDPNQGLYNIGGRPVWELVSDPPVIYVDGEEINLKFGWDAAYLPYEIDGKLIHIARKNGKYHIVYDGREFGPIFDRIFITYCCGYLSVTRGQGQFWFLGTRGESQYVVSIHGKQ